MGKLYCGCVINDGKRLWCDEHAKAEPVVVLPGATSALEKRVRELEGIIGRAKEAMRSLDRQVLLTPVPIEIERRHDDIEDALAGAYPATRGDAEWDALQKRVREMESALRTIAYIDLGSPDAWKAISIARDALKAPAPSATTAETATKRQLVPERSKEWWRAKADAEGDLPIGAGMLAKPAPPSSATFSAASSAKNTAPKTPPPSSAGEATCKWCSRPPREGDNVCQVCRDNMAAMSDLPGDSFGHIPDEIATLRADLATARAEVERLTRSLEAGLSPLDRHCADFLADEVAALVRRKVIDSRAPAADALLDYRNPPSSPRADRLAQLEAERDAATKRAESQSVALSRISGALVDSGVTVPADETKYDEAIRALAKQRDEAEAACAAMRDEIEALQRNMISSTDQCCDAWLRCVERSINAALTPGIGKAWLRERDELREWVAQLGLAYNTTAAERDRAVAERDGLARLIREALDDRHVVCDARFDDEGESVCIGEECMRERMRAALTPSAPSDDNGGGNG